MTYIEYNIIGFIALIFPIIFMLIPNRDERSLSFWKSLFQFIIIYGISFLITLFVFWFVKILI